MNSPCQIYGRYACDDHDDDLRETRCDNKGGQQLMEVSIVVLGWHSRYRILLISNGFLYLQSLKADLECGWDGTSCREAFILVVFTCAFLALFL